MDTAQEGARAFLRSPRAQLAECLLKREMFPVLLFGKYGYCDYGDNRRKARDGAKIALCVPFVECELPTAVSLVCPPWVSETPRYVTATYHSLHLLLAFRLILLL